MGPQNGGRFRQVGGRYPEVVVSSGLTVHTNSVTQLRKTKNIETQKLVQIPNRWISLSLSSTRAHFAARYMCVASAHHKN
jgi:hypothetical protein